MREAITNAVRVFVRVILGALVAFAASKLPIQFDPEQVTETLTLAIDGVIIGVVSAALLALEKRVPFLTQVLSLGTSKSPASYDQAAA
jgi:hypothetical protein